MVLSILLLSRATMKTIGLQIAEPAATWEITCIAMAAYRVSWYAYHGACQHMRA